MIVPEPVTLGPRSIDWPPSEVAAINAARIVGMPDNETGALVIRLEFARKSSAHVLLRHRPLSEQLQGHLLYQHQQGRRGQ